MRNKLFLTFSFLLITLSACTTTSTQVTTSSNLLNTTTNSTISTTNITTTTQVNEIDDCLEKAGFILTFCDSFNGNTIDLTKWGYQEGTGSQYGLDGWGNNEAQYYRKENARLENGKLIIEAKKETFGKKAYTSSRLYTDQTFTQKYGRFEASIKMPAGQGFWPAFWMMPKASVYGGWAASGELDIMEARGRLINEIGGTIHYGAEWPNNQHRGKTYYFPAGQNITQFHEYAVEWEPGEIRWYVDGKLYQTLNDWHSKDNPFPAPFDQEFYLILNLAIGGNYDGGRLPDASMLKAQMEVDYVRVYQFNYENDAENPSEVTNFHLSSSMPEKTVVEWDKATDDTGISEYEVYLNNKLVGNTLANKYTFTNLVLNNDYKISVVAVDMAGNKSEKSSFTFTVNYPLVTTRIEAENYLEMKGIQLEKTTDLGGGQNVGYIEKDDYLIYKVNVETSGTYKIVYRIASQSTGGDISLFINGNELCQTTFDKTGGWQVWRDVSSTTFELEAGIQTIKLVANKDGFNLNYFVFHRS